MNRAMTTGFMGHDRTYVIAEGGSNHGGSLDVALALIDAAAEAGADAFKTQAGHADHVYDPAQFPEEHAAIRKYLEPVLHWLPVLHKRCEERGIDFGCSAFCFDALDAVDPFVKWHKVASIEHGWTPFLMCVAEKMKPMIVSHGMREGQREYGLFPQEIVAMGCTVSYPCDLADAHIRSMPIAGPWGLSDHTTHPTIAPCAAVALGACVIEKHMRVDVTNHNDPAGLLVVPFWTPDTEHSINQYQFCEMVSAIRLTEKALGSSEKRIRESERPFLKYRRGPRGLRGA